VSTTKTVKTLAVVPINRLAAAKSRLAPALSGAGRRELALWMAGRVLEAVTRSGAVDEIAVVSPDEEALAWAHGCGAIPIWQEQGGLNAGLALAREDALARGADALLVLLGDLPRLTSGEVARLVSAGERAEAAHSVVLAPDREGQGTNGLLLRPPDLLPFAYGPGSFERHRAIARAFGVEPLVVASPGLAFDVDTPADLRELERCGVWAPDNGGGEGAALAHAGGGSGCHE
jgi:2-phospho-L-lactate/phosphoenolpyruvate guanylyltransferase